MKELTRAEYRDLLINMLRYVDSYCQEHGIKYYVGHGTLLGTIRHNGFIPWDDDVDICMQRDDYERFCAGFPGTNPRYYLLTRNESRTYCNNFARICDNMCLLKLKNTADIKNLGAFIDLFPIDKVPEQREKRERLYLELYEKGNLLRRFGKPLYCYRTLSMKNKVKMLLSFPSFIRSRLKGQKKMKAEIDALMVKYRHENTAIGANLFDKPSDKLIVFLEDIENLTRHRFENIEVNIPCNYDRVLKTQYGDYMKLPPVEMQRSLHHFVAYWRE